MWIKANGRDAVSQGPEIAYLWGRHEEGRSNGSFVRLPAGFVGSIHAHGPTFRAVVISGQLRYRGEVERSLEPGSYFGSGTTSLHEIAARRERGYCLRAYEWRV